MFAFFCIIRQISSYVYYQRKIILEPGKLGDGQTVGGSGSMREESSFLGELTRVETW